MPENIYSLVSGAMRYVFIALGIIIVLRSFFMLRRDRRNTRRRLRRLPDAGNVGELIVVRGSGDLAEGTAIPVPREGTLGCIRSCDLLVYSSDVRRKHLDFSFENGLGLLITPRSGCTALVDGIEFNCRTRAAGHPMIHGSFLQIGDLVFRLRLFAGVDIERGARFADDTGSVPPVYPVPAAGAAPFPDVSSSRIGEMPPASQYVPYTPAGTVSAPAPAGETVNGAPRRRRRTEGLDGDWDE